MLEALSYSSCSVLKSSTSSIRQWLIPSSWEACGQLNVTSAVMLQPPSSQASLPKCSYYSYSLLKRHRFQKILDQTNWLLLLPLVLMTVDESFLFWDLKMCEFSPCSGWSFSIWWCEVEPLERTGKKSSSLALSNHFGWQVWERTQSVDWQWYKYSGLDWQYAGYKPAGNGEIETWLLFFFSAPLWRHGGCPDTNFFPSPK